MLKEDIKKVKDQGKLFDRLNSDYDLGEFRERARCLTNGFLF